jgi:membrane protease YdiL (CAAX protease family)
VTIEEPSDTLSPRRALLALSLLAPVPSIGVVFAMLATPGPVGRTIFIACKLWLIAFPALWYLLVEGGRPSWSPPRLGGLGVGALTGIAMSAAILAGFYLFGSPLISGAELRAVVESVELGSPATFLAGAAYWVLVNSLVEEYVYRWFVLRQCRALMPDRAAVLGSALVFTVHHVIAVSVYLGPTLTVLGSAGVFLGGAVWSAMYLRFRSVWPSWISHVIVDIAVFAVGWRVLFAG